MKKEKPAGKSKLAFLFSFCDFELIAKNGANAGCALERFVNIKVNLFGDIYFSLDFVLIVFDVHFGLLLLTEARFELAFDARALA